MFNFFVDETKKQNDCYLITGSDYNHIKNVLRMNVGENLLVSCNGRSDLCRIEDFEDECVRVAVIEEDYRNTELPVQIYLFQGLPKNEKMELIIQKATELGAAGIIPVEMSRCVVKLDDKKKKSKQTRWQAIAESAAKQSKRNNIPEVFEVSPYNKALEMAKNFDLLLVPYENEEGMAATKKALCELENCKTVGIFIGPEGGFEEKEIEKAREAGGRIISLGDRILRTETAAVTAVAMCMLHIEMNVEDKN